MAGGGMAVAEAAPAADDLWLTEAGKAWREMHPLPRRGTREGDTPAWAFADICALRDTGDVARVMVAMGLRRVAVYARGELAWWPPEYWRWPRGRFLASRETLAAINAFRRDQPVYAMRAEDPDIIPRPDLLLFVERYTGEWRTASGGARGEDIVSLGAFCWRISRGQAAQRIVRVCGYQRLPRVGDLGG